MKNSILVYCRLVRAIRQAKREGRTDEFIKAAKETAEIQQIMLRPKRYEAINGAGEIGWGMFMLCMALASYSSVVLPNSMWRFRAGIGGLLMICGCLAMPLCLWASKKYVTRPCIGYFAFHWDKSRWIGLVVAAVVAAVVSFGLARLMQPEIIHMAQSQMHHSDATSPGTMSHASKIMLAGFIVSNTIMYLMMNAVSIREHRWKWLLLILIALGPLGIAYLIPGNYIEMFRPMGLFLGLLWFASGAVTLFWFLRHHQSTAPEAE